MVAQKFSTGTTITISACLGTAHFTRRSLLEAYEAVRKLKPTDSVVKPNMPHFHLLGGSVSLNRSVNPVCGDANLLRLLNALDNKDTKIRLIDMFEREIATNIRRLQPLSRLWWFSFVGFALVLSILQKESIRLNCESITIGFLQES